MNSVTITVDKYLADVLGVAAGGRAVKVESKIKIVEALKQIGIDVNSPAMQGRFLLVHNNRLIPTVGLAKDFFVQPGDVVILLPLPKGG